MVANSPDDDDLVLHAEEPEQYTGATYIDKGDAIEVVAVGVWRGRFRKPGPEEPGPDAAQWSPEIDD